MLAHFAVIGLLNACLLSRLCVLRYLIMRGLVKHSSLYRKIGMVVITAGLWMTACQGDGNGAPANTTPGTPTIEIQNAPTDPATEVAAIVNGQPIAVEAFRRELARFEAGQLALGFEIADQAHYEQQVLDLMVEKELIRQLAAQQGIAITDAQVDENINQMITESGQEYFNSWLSSNYYTLGEFREEIRLDLATNQLIQPVIDSVPAAVEQVHARHILVNTEDEANEVMARLQSGEDFGALAAEYSVDVTSSQNGGDLGWFPRGMLLVPEVEQAAFSLQPGQTSGIVPSALGYHIIQLLEFDPARAIDEETKQRLIESALEEWRLGLRNGAQIEQLIEF